MALSSRQKRKKNGRSFSGLGACCKIFPELCFIFGFFLFGSSSASFLYSFFSFFIDFFRVNNDQVNMILFSVETSGLDFVLREKKTETTSVKRFKYSRISFLFLFA